ncbi:MAG: hypothetical protein COZ80_05345 [Ignavibacteria bacterium CG_4_8_14_3_um_filter_37_9]|nr:DUF1207 domain-containing protein [Ignavibacteria bacterium]OIO18193.1 MAG: hypothetical protein AUJ54_08780 [Ignavibacteria bacterium CG1_02_37_35]PIP77838.1 MAG: hypothetical protein COW85_06885 [Ignavibacteria bacterium CG22_combo_CG10-13_8_21_14_all_37_15]PIW99448.1 MAG: hypothetical protein COZ80_05345 [Ignavibacteria bacterium CG_4_8_14_3_um_filter_37_9]PIX93630.1 MAG: hypothetical protein COZ25_09725 [Ignavibacteria bacterium CG_4_10_14_3_um_filter_37_18]PJC59667.1 MAG: hypothetical 
MKVRYLIFLGLIYFIGFPSQVYSQTQFEFLPDGLNFLPLRANNQEAKLGVLYYPENANLKVDIGNTMDLLSFQFPQSKSKLNLGIEFMAYASVIGYGQLRLQIDAIDGFFGGNATFSKPLNDNLLSLRLRFIHNSAHLVDGNYWVHPYPRDWAKPGGPIPFTRDFAELVAANTITVENYNLRYYGGFSFSARIRPDNLKRVSALSGFEINSDKIIGKLFDKPVNIFLAHNITYAGLPDYSFTNQSQLGVKFGSWESKGILFFFSFYSGNNMFSEYFDERINKVGFGFAVDFP